MIRSCLNHRLTRVSGALRSQRNARWIWLAVLLVAALGWQRPSTAADNQKTILMIAGNPSHGFGAHEHYAGLRVLADTLSSVGEELKIEVVRGWPENPQLIESADSIVIFADGGARHLAIPHLDALTKKLDQGCGLVCLHYAVEVPKGEPGEAWLKYLGGYFETDWSVNPHWKAEFQSLPSHPTTRGVKPFALQDEWYFHMRFNDAPGLTPILQAVAPESTMRRPDGPHSGNPAARKSVAAGEPQTVAWAFERPDGGRSFGFTGGHFHWNWGNPDVRKLVANAILWSAGGEVPSQGVGAKPLGVDTLLEHQDFPKPENFDPEATAREYDLSRSGGPANDDSSSPHDAANAVAGLDIAAGLEATLSASEPVIRNLTNLDIDDRGRVWVCDVMNYRRNNGSRPEGDRILIFEDTTGDGVMDHAKTFYQGNDIDSAMGICVLGNEVIVSAAPFVWRLIDDDGDDVADRKVAMFTQTGQPQHDHSNHSFIFGPDGKLYWNFGNTGKQVKDAQGNTVIDIHGRPVVDNGKPFFGGMVFRCDLDGSNFEVVAHNFRNNYETAVDSFGAIWQSDNDDDGNRGTRINFVMEYGNYGYRDEMTGANWQADRINVESEVPLRHWHLNDPGVVPNVLQTGAGSPSGICVYEGQLLPQRYRNQMIHCDPGPNAVRAYPTTAVGAGYTATILPLLTADTDKWFRPVDVCAAPDGSLFVTDWYDPGVGGHRQEEVERGRLYRIAPPGSRYTIAKFDYSTAAGAVEALRSPTSAVRYKAWMALHAMGKAAEPALQELYADPDARLRARALWLLGKIPGRGEHYVRLALADENEDIRMTGIRLMRQLDLVPAEVLSTIADEPSPGVRREALIALRYDRSAAMPELWAQLARRYDGHDRWYLEALGIASDVRPSECYQALMQAVGEASDTAAITDILWRLRADEAAHRLVQRIADRQTELAETDRYFRALEFHSPAVRSRLLSSAFLNRQFATAETQRKMQSRNDAIIVRSLERSDWEDRGGEPAIGQAVDRHLRSIQGTAEFVRLVKRFRPEGYDDELLQLALAADDDSVSVEAVRLVALAQGGRERIETALTSATPDQAARLAKRLGMLGGNRAIEILAALASDAALQYPLRSEAVRGLAKSPAGSKRLLAMANSGDLAADTRLLAGGLLGRSEDAEIRRVAAELLPRPAQADARPLPPLDELVALRGDVQRGQDLFRTKATCSNCHVAAAHGKQVGPELSEIGTKLSREALFTSILDPSAGVSHNYETYLALLDSGQIVSGVLVTQTDQSVTLRTAEAIDRVIDQNEIVELKKSEKSMMPDDLHQAVDQQGLVDIVEYMLTLKKQD